jgi:hypothetical protein
MDRARNDRFVAGRASARGRILSIEVVVKVPRLGAEKKAPPSTFLLSRFEAPQLRAQYDLQSL